MLWLRLHTSSTELTELLYISTEARPEIFMVNQFQYFVLIEMSSKNVIMIILENVCVKITSRQYIDFVIKMEKTVGIYRLSVIYGDVCCDNHLSQGQMITQGVNLLVRVSSGEFTRELDKESLLNQSSIYTKHAWSVLPIFNPTLMSMLHPHSCLMFYSRPPCVFHVP